MSRRWGVWRLFARLLLVLATCSATAAFATDLQVSQYSFTPDPVANSGTATFSVRVTNNGPSTIGDATLAIAVSSRFRVDASGVPAYCSVSGSVGAQTISCALPSLSVGNATVSYTAIANQTGSADTTATISSPTAADTNSSNNSLTITPSVVTGADLTVSKADNVAGHHIAAGGTIAYSLVVHNAGPSATDAVTLTDNLPAFTDLQYVSASGAGWSCSQSNQVVTCTYGGTAVLGDYPTVTINGKVVRATSGTITNNAFVALNSPLVGDPNPNNNTSGAVVTTIDPGTDLAATLSMPTSFQVGQSLTVTIGANNVGPQDVTGATVTDTFDASLTVTTVPTGCTASGQTVTCTTDALPAGSQETFGITVTGASATSGNVPNIVTVAPPNGAVDPVSSNNQAAALFQVQASSADLLIVGSRPTTPIQAGQQLRFQLSVINAGPSDVSYSPTQTIRVTDTVSPDEIFDAADAGWNCTQNGIHIVCDYGGTGTFPNHGELDFSIYTHASASASGALTATACTGQTGGSTATPLDPNPANDCTSSTVNASSGTGDIAIAKSVSLFPGSGFTAGPLTVPGANSSFYIQLVATNNGPDSASGIIVNDPIAGNYNDGTNTTAYAVVDTSGTVISPGNVSFGANGALTWTVGTLANGASATLIVRVTRPVDPGGVGATLTNTATIVSTDTYDSNSANNSASASYILQPVADVAVTQVTVSPNPVQVGVTSTYTISTRNNGPNYAENVTLTDVIDTTKFELVGAPSTTKGDGTCSVTNGTNTATVSCNLGTYQAGNAYQVSQAVRAKLPFGGSSSFPASYTDTATIATTTPETTTANNSSSVTHDVTAPSLDLSITKQEPGPEYDPISYGAEMTYDIRVSNFGPSRANNVVVLDTPQPPTGYGMTFAGYSVNDVAATSGLSLYTPPHPSCTVVSGTQVQCLLDSTNSANNYLDPLYQTIFRVRFTPTGTAPTGPLTFTDSAQVTATEQPTTNVTLGDAQLANNVATQTTTVLPSSDLEVVSKTRVTASPAATNAPIEYSIVIRNNGVSPTTQVRVTDALPAGFALATPVATATAAGTASVSAISCTDSAANTVLCILDGSFPADGSQVTISLRVKAVDPYSGPRSTDLTNTATITPGLDSGGNPLTVDAVSTNNSKTATVQIAPANSSSIAGRVFRDANSDNAIQSGEELAGVTVTLTRTDTTGTGPFTTTTDATGTFTFTALPAGTYTLTETQPTGLNDGSETAGTSGGTVDNTAFDATSAHNSITGIVLASSTAATGYLFQELVPVTTASISGTVFADANGDNAVQSGEGLAGVTVTLSGTDGLGNTVGPVTATTNASGVFSFTGLAAGTYTIVETQPSGYFDGRETAGTAAGTVNNAAFGTTSVTNTISAIALTAGATGAGYLFQELSPASVSGSIYADTNNNGTRDAGESGFAPGSFPASPQVRITGTDYSGQALDQSATVDASGGYSFTGLPPSDGSGYTVTELVEPNNTLDGLDRNGGSVVPNSAGRASPESILVGSVAAGAALTNRDFGESTGVSLSGSIFFDPNGNAIRDAGETMGLAGGVVRLTGTNDLGVSVDCSITTGSDGSYSFPLASDPVAACRTLRAGNYTLSETPPAGFTHVGAYVGSAGGSAGGVSGANRAAPGAGNNAIAGIALTSGWGTDYNFAEGGQGLAGYVYVDGNGNGVRDAGEAGIPGVTVTLSGNAAGGQSICAITTCTATTGSTGDFAFANVPGSDATGYTLTEQAQTQSPLSAFGDGADGTGTVNGAARGTAGNDVISGIVLAAGELGANYRFGEHGASMAGHVFVDANNDGVFQTGETAIAGVVVTLSGATGLGQDICAYRNGQTPALGCTFTTGSDGAYRFADLPAGRYTIVETQPAAYADGKEGAGSPGGTIDNTSFGAAAATNSIAGVNLTAGTVGTGYDFGERGVSISGRVFKDPQRDGVDSGGEPGIGGVTVRLLQNGVVVASQDTAADGSYSFAGLTLGSYSVVEEQPMGYGSSSPNSVAVTLAGTAQVVNFAETVSTLAGAIFFDGNNDGVRQTGERGIAGVTVTLTGTDQAGAAVSRTTTSGTDGGFQFTDLLAGSYTLTETQPTAYVDGFDSAGNAGGTVANDVISAILLPAGIDATSYGFGERGQALSGAVYLDANNNGTRDGEAGIAGVTVTLQRADGTVVATTTTTGDGSYSFANLELGAYVVVETQPTGYSEGKENSADRVSVTVGTAAPAPINFGERTPQSLAGIVYVDSNVNGRQDTGERGIPGVTITLQRTDGSVVATTTTGSDGAYQFAGLDVGSYVVIETQPAGYLDAPENANNRATATVTATGPPAINFGERGQSLGGVVYIDSNLNGTRDTNETGVAGVTLSLQRPDGTVVATTTTAADGSYGFSGLSTGDYVVVETQPAGYGDAAENSTNRATVTIGAAAVPTVNFGEKVGSIAGLVYDDSNFDGKRQANEPVIRGVTVTLSGTDSLGNAVSQTAVTGVDGTFKFTGVPGGTYRLVETQPQGWQDDVDLPGTSGGTALPVPGDTISNIVLGPAQDATGYIFAERGQGAELSGSIWFDANHDGIRQSNEPGKGGWTVEIYLGDVLIGTATSAADGTYQFHDLPPGTGYGLKFREPDSTVSFGGAKTNESGIPAQDGVVSPGNPGGAFFQIGALSNITLTPGANLTQQSLPLDPSGVLFDPVNCVPIKGAKVTFSGPPGFDPATQLLGGLANVTQITGDEGFYQFLLLPGAPNGVYTISVSGPAGGIYSAVFPSSQFPPQPGALAVGPFPNPLLVSPTNSTCGTNTAPYYYLSFNLVAGYSADVLNNNIPLDPILKGSIVVTKTTPMKNVTRGGLVPYSITARNALTGVVPNISIVDNLPAGFRYRDGSARLNGLPVTPIVNGRTLTFPPANFAVGETKKIDLILTVGAGVGEGEHINQAWAVNPNVGTVVSNVAEATVRIEPDADFDCSDIIGKVFDDKNGNGYEDPGEGGLPGVRVATVAGDLITTDAEGRYHITCPMIPNEDRGSNFILKLDTRTLPTGYRMTSENPETIRLTRGKAAKLNFGAALLRVVRLDVRDTVFAGNDVAPDYAAKVDALIATLEGEPSVLRITYTAHGEEAGTVRKRIAALKALVEHKWSEKKDRYRLIVETETAP